MKNIIYFLLFITFVIEVSSCPNMKEDQKMTQDYSASSTIKATDFPSHLEWLNTSRKYSIKDFRGKIVLLDFWTYCCINCMHVIPDLKKLEEKYPELVVIGVHSAKFHNEKIKENIQQAILRYNIEHPVVIDNNFVLWRAYAISAWPSFILIDPEGYVVGKTTGEGIYDKIDPVIAKLSEEFEKRGLLNKEQCKFKLLKYEAPESLLYFPGKLTVHPLSRRIFITDSNHNRIIVTNPEGEILEVLGSGEIGKSDGDFQSATFFRPQGIAFDNKRNCLYIADTENHLIRKADFKTKNVTTILGTGRQGNLAIKEGKGINVPLNSPWDVTILRDYLYIAMAGSHQIWRMHLESFEAEVYAGSGREDIIDGARNNAALAQPSGITTDGKIIYFADSEVSAVRKIANDTVDTIIGAGLFDFGDIDGYYPKARLQHPIGIHYHDGFLYIADTYNHKIKKVSTNEKKIVTFIGTGKRGFKDDKAHKAQLNEPNDIVFLDGKFYIADTNNHLIRIYDSSKKEVSTLHFKNIEALTPKKPEEEKYVYGKSITLSERIISRKAKSIHFRLYLPDNYKWTRDAPNSIKLISKNEDILRILSVQLGERFFDSIIPIEVVNLGKTIIRSQIQAYYCDANKQALCYFQSLEILQPIVIKDKGEDDLKITYSLVPQ